MSVDVGVSPVQIPKQLPSWTEALDQKIISLSPSPNPSRAPTLYIYIYILDMSEELEFERAEVERQVDEKKYSEERNIPMISESPMTERADQPHNALQEITQLRSEMVGLSQLLKVYIILYIYIYIVIKLHTREGRIWAIDTKISLINSPHRTKGIFTVDCYIQAAPRKQSRARICNIPLEHNSRRGERIHKQRVNLSYIPKIGIRDNREHPIIKRQRRR